MTGGRGGVSHSVLFSSRLHIRLLFILCVEEAIWKHSGIKRFGRPGLHPEPCCGTYRVRGFLRSRAIQIYIYLLTYSADLVLSHCPSSSPTPTVSLYASNFRPSCLDPPSSVLLVKNPRSASGASLLYNLKHSTTTSVNPVLQQLICQ